MEPYVNMLFDAIQRYYLEQREYDLVAQIRYLSQLGKLTDGRARANLIQLAPMIEEQERRMNRLPRCPTSEEMYPHGLPALNLGHLVERLDVVLGIDPAAANAILSGIPGSGKTTLFRRFALAVHEFNQRHPDRFIRLVIFDRKGGDFADCKQLFSDQCLHLSVHEGLRIGLNAPSSVPVRAWVNTLANVIAARGNLIAAETTLAGMIEFLVAAMNPNSGQALLWPSFKMLLELAQTAPLDAFASKAEYGKSLVQSLEGTVRGGGQLLDTFSGFDVEQHALAQKKHVVFDMVGFDPPSLRALITDIVVLQLLLGRQFAYRRQTFVDTFVLVDEADADVDRKASAAFRDGLSTLDRLAKQGRENGVACWLSVAELTVLSRLTAASTNHHFAFAPADGVARNAAAAALDLRGGADSILPALRPGECVYRHAGGWPGAVLAKIEEVAPSRCARPDYFDTHPHVPAQSLHEMPNVVEAVKKHVTSENAKRSRQRRLAKPELRVNARRLLEQAAKNIDLSAIELWRAIGKVPGKSTRAKVQDELRELGYVTLTDARYGKRTLALIELTDAGWEFLHLPSKKMSGRGEIKHRYAQHAIARWARAKGAEEAVVEWQVPGPANHAVDVGLCFDGAWTAAEVALDCIDNLPGHVHSCLVESDAVKDMTIVTACANEHPIVRAILEPHVPPELLSRITLRGVEYYLKELS